MKEYYVVMANGAAYLASGKDVLQAVAMAEMVHTSPVFANMPNETPKREFETADLN